MSTVVRKIANYNWTVIHAIQISSATLSLVMSSAMMGNILLLPASTRFSRPYSRIIFMLSVTDIMQSFAFASGPFLVPKELEVTDTIARDSWAIGNEYSCAFNGILIMLGSTLVPTYTLTLCLYYLFATKYNFSDDKFGRRIEMKIHVMNFILAAVASTLGLLLGAFTPLHEGAYCYFEPTNYIPIYTQFLILVLCLIGVVYSMSLLWRFVMQQERRNDRLRFSIARPPRGSIRGSFNSTTSSNVLRGSLLSRRSSASNVNPAGDVNPNPTTTKLAGAPIRRGSSGLGRTSIISNETTNRSSNLAEDTVKEIRQSIKKSTASQIGGNDENKAGGSIPERRGSIIQRFQQSRRSSLDFDLSSNIPEERRRGSIIQQFQQSRRSSLNFELSNSIPEERRGSIIQRFQQARRSSLRRSSLNFDLSNNIPEERRGSIIQQFQQSRSSSVNFDPSLTETRGERRSRKKKRDLTIQCSLYGIAFLVVYLLPALDGILYAFDLALPEPLMALAYLLYPMGGVFNILVYTRPRISSLRMQHNDYSWLKAFILVFKKGGAMTMSRRGFRGDLPLSQEQRGRPPEWRGKIRIKRRALFGKIFRSNATTIRSNKEEMDCEAQSKIEDI